MLVLISLIGSLFAALFGFLVHLLLKDFGIETNHNLMAAIPVTAFAAISFLGDVISRSNAAYKAGKYES